MRSLIASLNSGKRTDDGKKKKKMKTGRGRKNEQAGLFGGLEVWLLCFVLASKQ